MNDDMKDMTLRDYFAASSVGGLFSIITPGDFKVLTAEQLRERIAVGAYLVADAMLKEREKQV